MLSAALWTLKLSKPIKPNLTLHWFVSRASDSAASSQPRFRSGEKLLFNREKHGRKAPRLQHNQHYLKSSHDCECNFEKMIELAELNHVSATCCRGISMFLQTDVKLRDVCRAATESCRQTEKKNRSLSCCPPSHSQTSPLRLRVHPPPPWNNHREVINSASVCFCDFLLHRVCQKNTDFSLRFRLKVSTFDGSLWNTVDTFMILTQWILIRWTINPHFHIYSEISQLLLQSFPYCLPAAEE